MYVHPSIYESIYESYLSMASWVEACWATSCAWMPAASSGNRCPPCRRRGGSVAQRRVTAPRRDPWCNLQVRPFFVIMSLHSYIYIYVKLYYTYICVCMCILYICMCMCIIYIYIYLFILYIYNTQIYIIFYIYIWFNSILHYYIILYSIAYYLIY